MDNLNVGVGRMEPADAPVFAEITLTVRDGVIADATFTCSPQPVLTACAETLCRSISGFPAADLFQMNNNVIYYNTERELKREELWLASVCVLAAKRAAADWCRKNGVPFQSDCCDCV